MGKMRAARRDWRMACAGERPSPGPGKIGRGRGRGLEAGTTHLRRSRAAATRRKQPPGGKRLQGTHGRCCRSVIEARIGGREGGRRVNQSIGWEGWGFRVGRKGGTSRGGMWGSAGAT